jgi:hypothetical protein
VRTGQGEGRQAWPSNSQCAEEESETLAFEPGLLLLSEIPRHSVSPAGTLGSVAITGCARKLALHLTRSPAPCLYPPLDS